MNCDRDGSRTGDGRGITGIRLPVDQDAESSGRWSRSGGDAGPEAAADGERAAAHSTDAGLADGAVEREKILESLRPLSSQILWEQREDNFAYGR